MLIDLTLNNPQFAKLRTLKPTPSQNSLAIPNSALPKAIKAGLQEIYLAMTGEKLDDAKCTLLATFDNGEFHRLYGPAVYRQGEQLILKWGDEALPVTIDGQDFVVGGLSGELVREKYGRYDESTLQWFLEAEDGSEYTFKAIIKSADYKVPIEPAKIKAQLKKGNTQALLSLVAEPGSNSESSNGRPRIEVDLANAFDIRSAIPQDFDDEGKPLQGQLEFICWGAQRIKTSWGSTYALRIPAQPGLEAFIEEGQVGTAWSQKSINAYCEGGYAPTEAEPGLITIIATPWANDPSKRSYKASVSGGAWLDDGDGIDLSFISVA